MANLPGHPDSLSGERMRDVIDWILAPPGPIMRVMARGMVYSFFISIAIMVFIALFVELE